MLDYASRNREPLLYNIWLMGHNAIKHGRRDSWTITPKVVEAAQGGPAAAARPWLRVAAWRPCGWWRKDGAGRAERRQGV